jgi:hypothetical protein
VHGCGLCGIGNWVRRSGFLQSPANRLGWWVYTSRLEIGGVVAFISGIGRLNDPWGALVNYFRDVNVAQIKYRLLADAVNQLAPAGFAGTMVEAEHGGHNKS